MRNLPAADRADIESARHRDVLPVAITALGFDVVCDICLAMRDSRDIWEAEKRPHEKKCAKISS